MLTFKKCENPSVHEVGIMANILRTAEEAARQGNGSKILKLRIRIGSMSGIVSDALQFAFEALRVGTMADGAELEIEIVPAVCQCRDCNIDYKPDEIDFLCPKCGGSNIKLLKGRELEIISVDYL